MRYIYKIKCHDGRYLETEAESQEQARQNLGLDSADIKRAMPVKCLDTIKVMSEETKEKLRAIQAERRELRKVRPRKQTTVSAPRIEHTEAGSQTVIADTPRRTVPNKKLVPKRRQNEKPLALELPAIEAQQIKLF